VCVCLCVCVTLLRWHWRFQDIVLEHLPVAEVYACVRVVYRQGDQWWMESNVKLWVRGRGEREREREREEGGRRVRRSWKPIEASSKCIIRHRGWLRGKLHIDWPQKHPVLQKIYFISFLSHFLYFIVLSAVTAGTDPKLLKLHVISLPGNWHLTTLFFSLCLPNLFFEVYIKKGTSGRNYQNRTPWRLVFVTETAFSQNVAHAWCSMCVQNVQWWK
jgi:hypothetical protein